MESIYIFDRCKFSYNKVVNNSINIIDVQQIINDINNF